MKRILLLILFIFLCLPVFADYQPIPKQLSAKYKAEMENIINNEYPLAIQKVDEYVNEANTYYKRVLLKGYNSDNQMNAINLNLLYENGFPTADLDIYSKLMKVTQEKYLKVNYSPIATDWVTPYADFMQPYFKDNNVNTKKLDEIVNYESKQSKVVKTMLEEVQKLRPTY